MDQTAREKDDTAVIDFISLCYTSAVEYPDLFPLFAEKDVFREDYLIAERLWKLGCRIEQLRDILDYNGQLADLNALNHSMAFYQTVKIAARRNIPGARVLFEELKPALPSGLFKFMKQGSLIYR